MHSGPHTDALSASSHDFGCQNFGDGSHNHIEQSILVVFMAGKQQFWFTGANRENFETHMQQNLTAKENPASGLSMFARRAHRAKVGLTRS